MAPSAALEAVAAAPPAGHAGIAQHARERRSEPEQFQEGKAEDHGGDQNPSTVTVEEREKLSGRRAELRLVTVNEERDDDQDDEKSASGRLRLERAGADEFSVVCQSLPRTDP
jgi:hypothetical protein